MELGTLTEGDSLDARSKSLWVTCQLGAREQYTIPRTLVKVGADVKLFTDIWVPPTTTSRWISKQLGSRWHPELLNEACSVKSVNVRALASKAFRGLQSKSGNERIIAENRWFQLQAAKYVRSLEAPRETDVTLFAYSYAAKEILKAAKERGWRTVLGQIDPGPNEADIVYKRALALGVRDMSGYHRMPEHYWASWRDEIHLADRVIVNSEWSKRSLVFAGVPENKLAVIPLARARGAASPIAEERPPAPTTPPSPFKVLFLGQAILRKGIYELLSAAKRLSNSNIEIHIVGPADKDIRSKMRGLENVHWHGVVPNGDIEKYFRNADVFIFPTHSDGFGMTQLEALMYGVPVIASGNCAEIIQHGHNGLVLDAVTDKHITESILQLRNNPALLRQLTFGASKTELPSSDLISKYLSRLFF